MDAVIGSAGNDPSSRSRTITGLDPAYHRAPYYDIAERWMFTSKRALFWLIVFDSDFVVSPLY